MNLPIESIYKTSVLRYSVLAVVKVDSVDSDDASCVTHLTLDYDVRSATGKYSSCFWKLKLNLIEFITSK